MTKILDDSVSQADDGSWTFQCPGIVGSLCGDPETGRGFSSPGWPTKKVAAARGSEHFDDHKLGMHFRLAVASAGDDPDHAALWEQSLEETGLQPSSSLEDFRAKHNLVAHPNGTHAVRIEDLP